MSQIAKPILSVVVPTYNRGGYLPGIFYFFECVLDRGILAPGELEVVISNNCSTDSTSEVLKAAPSRLPLKVVSPEEHLTTAEENLFFGISKSTGHFIWLLGDDDSPNLKIFENLVQRIRQDKDDIIICSSSGSSYSGQIHDTRTICSDQARLPNLLEFARRTGFLFTLAGFSTTLVRGDIARANLDVFKVYFGTSQIYSHVFWILDVFHNKRFHYFSQNLVCYKENASDVTDTGHWKAYAVKMGNFERFPWTVGLARLCNKLRERIHVPTGWFGEVIDQNWGQRFRLLDMMVRGFVAQVESQRGRASCRPMSPAEAVEFFSFLYRESAMYSQLLAPLGIHSGSDMKSIDGMALQHLGDQLNPNIGGHFYRRYVVSKVNGWTIYHFHDQYFASTQDSRDPKSVEQFRDICPVEGDHFLVADTWEAILQKCTAKPAIRIQTEKRIIGVNGNGCGEYLPSASPDYGGPLSDEDVAFVSRLRRAAIRMKKWIPAWLLRASRF